MLYAIVFFIGLHLLLREKSPPSTPGLPGRDPRLSTWSRPAPPPPPPPVAPSELARRRLQAQIGDLERQLNQAHHTDERVLKAFDAARTEVVLRRLNKIPISGLEVKGVGEVGFDALIAAGVSTVFDLRTLRPGQVEGFGEAKLAALKAAQVEEQAKIEIAVKALSPKELDELCDGAISKVQLESAAGRVARDREIHRAKVRLAELKSRLQDLTTA